MSDLDDKLREIVSPMETTGYELDEIVAQIKQVFLGDGWVPEKYMLLPEEIELLAKAKEARGISDE